MARGIAYDTYLNRTFISGGGLIILTELLSQKVSIDIEVAHNALYTIYCFLIERYLVAYCSEFHLQAQYVVSPAGVILDRQGNSQLLDGLMASPIPQ